LENSTYLDKISKIKGATIEFYDLKTKKYCPKDLDGDCEITSLLGIFLPWMEKHIFICISI